VVGMDAYRGFTFEVELDPQAEPFLHDHAMDETPLLPGVMGIEGFAEVANLIASGLCPNGGGFHVTAIEDVRFETPFKFYRQEPRTLTWRALVTPEGSGLAAQVTLESSRKLKVQDSMQHTVHFAGRVHLEPVVGEGAADQISAPAPNWNGAQMVEPEAIYRVYFHGPGFQVLEGVKAEDGRVVGKLRSDLPPMTQHARQVMAWPRLIELCLQTAGIWEIGRTGALALPTAIERVAIHRAGMLVDTHQGDVPPSGEIGGGVYAEIEPTACRDDELCFNARVVDGQGKVYLELIGYRTARLPGTVADELLAPLRVVSEDRGS